VGDGGRGGEVVAEERWITGFVEGELHVGDGGRGVEGGSRRAAGSWASLEASCMSGRW
jgi:hypothetical protein